MKYDYDFFAQKVGYNKLYFVKTLSAILVMAPLGKINYSRWRPRWLPKYNFHYVSETFRTPDSEI